MHTNTLIKDKNEFIRLCYHSFNWPYITFLNSSIAQTDIDTKAPGIEGFGKKDLISNLLKDKGFSTAEFSINGDYQLQKNLLIRMEEKIFKSQEKVFEKQKNDFLAI